MLSEFRNRLRQPAAGKAPGSQPDLGGEVNEPALMAWEVCAPDTPYETRTHLNPVEAEWREKIYQQLLKVMDLSLLDALEPAEAARQIREICLRLLDEHS